MSRKLLTGCTQWVVISVFFSGWQSATTGIPRHGPHVTQLLPWIGLEAPLPDCVVKWTHHSGEPAEKDRRVSYQEQSEV